MKKTIILLIGLIAMISCTGIDQLAMKEPYTIKISQQKDIRGNFTSKEFLLYKDITFMVNEKTFLEINKNIMADNTQIYTAMLLWHGRKWKFLENIFFKLDDALFEFKDDKPQREVLNANFIAERLIFILDNSFIQKMQNAKKIQIQFGNNSEPVEIENAGILRLQQFLK